MYVWQGTKRPNLLMFGRRALISRRRCRRWRRFNRSSGGRGEKVGVGEFLWRLRSLRCRRRLLGLVFAILFIGSSFLNKWYSRSGCLSAPFPSRFLGEGMSLRCFCFIFIFLVLTWCNNDCSFCINFIFCCCVIAGTRENSWRKRSRKGDRSV